MKIPNDAYSILLEFSKFTGSHSNKKMEAGLAQ
jgi:hypothetical protein